MSLLIYGLVLLILAPYNLYKHYNTASWIDDMAPEHTLIQMQKVFMSTIGMLMAENVLHYSYLESCPWTIERATRNDFVLQVSHFLSTVIDASFIYMTLVTAIGYGVARANLTMFEIKFLFGLTASKFVLI